MTTQPLVIIPCGGKKADAPRPARDLYIGSYFRACLATALAVGPADRVRILSAKHGLLSLDAEVAPYELRMDSPIARFLGASCASRLRAPACSTPRTSSSWPALR